MLAFRCSSALRLSIASFAVRLTDLHPLPSTGPFEGLAAPLCLGSNVGNGFLGRRGSKSALGIGGTWSTGILFSFLPARLTVWTVGRGAADCPVTNRWLGFGGRSVWRCLGLGFGLDAVGGGGRGNTEVAVDGRGFFFVGEGSVESVSVGRSSGNSLRNMSSCWVTRLGDLDVDAGGLPPFRGCFTADEDGVSGDTDLGETEVFTVLVEDPSVGEDCAAGEDEGGLAEEDGVGGGESLGC